MRSSMTFWDLPWRRILLFLCSFPASLRINCGAQEATVFFEDSRASPTHVPLNHSEHFGEAQPGDVYMRRLSSGLAAVTSLSFTDTDTRVFFVGGTVSWVAPADLTGIVQYHVRLNWDLSDTSVKTQLFDTANPAPCMCVLDPTTNWLFGPSETRSDDSLDLATYPADQYPAQWLFVLSAGASPAGQLAAGDPIQTVSEATHMRLIDVQSTNLPTSLQLETLNFMDQTNPANSGTHVEGILDWTTTGPDYPQVSEDWGLADSFEVFLAEAGSLSGTLTRSLGTVAIGTASGVTTRQLTIPETLLSGADAFVVKAINSVGQAPLSASQSEVFLLPTTTSTSVTTTTTILYSLAGLQVTFSDTDTNPEVLSGVISWQEPLSTAEITSYAVYMSYESAGSQKLLISNAVSPPATSLTISGLMRQTGDPTFPANWLIVYPMVQGALAPVSMAAYVELYDDRGSALPAPAFSSVDFTDEDAAGGYASGTVRWVLDGNVDLAYITEYVVFIAADQAGTSAVQFGDPVPVGTNEVTVIDTGSGNGVYIDANYHVIIFARNPYGSEAGYIGTPGVTSFVFNDVGSSTSTSATRSSSSTTTMSTASSTTTRTTSSARTSTTTSRTMSTASSTTTRTTSSATTSTTTSRTTSTMSSLTTSRTLTATSSTLTSTSSVGITETATSATATLTESLTTTVTTRTSRTVTATSSTMTLTSITSTTGTSTSMTYSSSTATASTSTTATTSSSTTSTTLLPSLVLPSNMDRDNPHTSVVAASLQAALAAVSSDEDIFSLETEAGNATVVKLSRSSSLDPSDFPLVYRFNRQGEGQARFGPIIVSVPLSAVSQAEENGNVMLSIVQVKEDVTNMLSDSGPSMTKVVLSAPPVELSFIQENSGVVAVADISNLPEPVTFRLQDASPVEGDTCAFFDLDKNSWSMDGFVTFAGEATLPGGTWCATTHLSLFSMVQTVPFEMTIQPKDYVVENENYIVAVWLLALLTCAVCSMFGTWLFLRVRPASRGSTRIKDKRGTSLVVQFTRSDIVVDKATSEPKPWLRATSEKTKVLMTWEVQPADVMPNLDNLEGPAGWVAMDIHSPRIVEKSKSLKDGPSVPKELKKAKDQEEECEDMLNDDVPWEMREAPVYEVYKDRERVNYWSATHQKLMPAFVSGSAAWDYDGPCYNVMVGPAGRQQLREKVPCHLLSRAFQDGEPVFYQEGDRQKRIWREAIVAQNIHVKAVIQVWDLVKGGKKSVPFGRVCRRYVNHGAVLVYRGIDKGWHEGVVDGVEDVSDRLSPLEVTTIKVRFPGEVDPVVVETCYVDATKELIPQDRLANLCGLDSGQKKKPISL